MTATGKKIAKTGIAAAALLIVLIVLLTVRTVSTDAAEFWTRNVTQRLVWLPAHVASLLPFSLFEILVFALAAACIVLIILCFVALVKKKFTVVLRGLLWVAIVGLSLGNYYTLTAGFAYNRAPVPVPQSETAYTNDEVIEITEYFLRDYNALALALPRDESGNVISPYSLPELSDKIAAEYARLGGDYFFAYTPKAKGMLNSWFMTLTGITGITLLPLGEPVVNTQTPPSDLPQTMAHEMAHAKGVMREGDCNFVAYYVLLSSNDDYLRYCGYFSVFYHLLHAVDMGQSSTQNYERLAEQISPLIDAEQTNAFLFWVERGAQPGLAGAVNRLFDSIGNFFNNLYLKLSGADNGTGSYDDTKGDGNLVDTGQTDPDTGAPVYEVTYSSVQKMFFALYESQI